jgi:hypothetical protein
MANPIGIVARSIHQVIGGTSDYFKKFDHMMKTGHYENVVSTIWAK